MKNHTYHGKVAIITGGASGIGEALAKALSGDGAKVVIADRQIALAESVAAAIRARGGDAVAMELDVRDGGAMQRVVDQTLARWAFVHYFFNNAGIGSGREVSDYELRDWDDVFDVNVRGVAYGIQAVYPVMIRQREGHIVNTASIAGLAVAPGQTVYCASKHAIVGLSKTLRIEAKLHGVRVSALCPGVVRTPLLTGGKYGSEDLDASMLDKAREHWEQFRPANADEVAGKVLKAVARNEAIIVVPARWKLLWWLDRVSPALSLAVMSAWYTRARTKLEAVGLRSKRRPARSAEHVNGPAPLR